MAIQNIAVTLPNNPTVVYRDCYIDAHGNVRDLKTNEIVTPVNPPKKS